MEVGEGSAPVTIAPTEPTIPVTAAPTEPPEPATPVVTEKPATPTPIPAKPMESPSESTAIGTPPAVQTPADQPMEKAAAESVLQRSAGLEAEETPAALTENEEQEKEETSSKARKSAASKKSTVHTDGQIRFFHEEGEQTLGFLPKIRIKSLQSLQVLSFRINGEEVFWHWQGSTLVPENFRLRLGENLAELLIWTEAGRLREMETWAFSVKR